MARPGLENIPFLSALPDIPHFYTQTPGFSFIVDAIALTVLFASLLAPLGARVLGTAAEKHGKKFGAVLGVILGLSAAFALRQAGIRLFEFWFTTVAAAAVIGITLYMMLNRLPGIRKHKIIIGIIALLIAWMIMDFWFAATGTQTVRNVFGFVSMLGPVIFLIFLIYAISKMFGAPAGAAGAGAAGAAAAGPGRFKRAAGWTWDNIIKPVGKGIGKAVGWAGGQVLGAVPGMAADVKRRNAAKAVAATARTAQTAAEHAAAATLEIAQALAMTQPAASARQAASTAATAANQARTAADAAQLAANAVPLMPKREKDEGPALKYAATAAQQAVAAAQQAIAAAAEATIAANLAVSVVPAVRPAANAIAQAESQAAAAVQQAENAADSATSLADDPDFKAVFKATVEAVQKAANQVSSAAEAVERATLSARQVAAIARQQRGSPPQGMPPTPIPAPPPTGRPPTVPQPPVVPPVAPPPEPTTPEGAIAIVGKEGEETTKDIKKTDQAAKAATSATAAAGKKAEAAEKETTKASDDVEELMRMLGIDPTKRIPPPPKQSDIDAFKKEAKEQIEKLSRLVLSHEKYLGEVNAAISQSQLTDTFVSRAITRFNGFFRLIGLFEKQLGKLEAEAQTVTDAPTRAKAIGDIAEIKKDVAALKGSLNPELQAIKSLEQHQTRSQNVPLAQLAAAIERDLETVKGIPQDIARFTAEMSTLTMDAWPPRLREIDDKINMLDRLRKDWEDVSTRSTYNESVLKTMRIDLAAWSDAYTTLSAEAVKDIKKRVFAVRTAIDDAKAAAEAKKAQLPTGPELEIENLYKEIEELIKLLRTTITYIVGENGLQKELGDIIKTPTFHKEQLDKEIKEAYGAVETSKAQLKVSQEHFEKILRLFTAAITQFRTSEQDINWPEPERKQFKDLREKLEAFMEKAESIAPIFTNTPEFIKQKMNEIATKKFDKDQSSTGLNTVLKEFREHLEKMLIPVLELLSEIDRSRKQLLKVQSRRA